ncbi:MAG: hypothetical protein AB7I50_17955 [Vicinamibacterales bacterium]
MIGIHRLRTMAMACALVLVALPVSAQIDLNGSWTSRMYEDWPERGPGRDTVDYTGLPLTDEARSKGLKWQQAVYAMIERQCLLLSPYVVAFEPQGLRIWSEMDASGRIVSWNVGGTIEKAILTIWMDGRQPPSAMGPYSFSGFSTGRWEGDTLVVKTTHLKAGHLRRGNGSPSSDQATITAFFTRHDDLITVTTVEEDPIYLSEPWVVSRTWQLDPRGNIGFASPCFAKTELPRLEDTGVVPHYLPGENSEADFMIKTYNLPKEAVLGYAETLWPEYRKKIKDSYTPPDVCARYCCGWAGFQGLNDSAPGLRCIIGGGYGLQDEVLLKEMRDKAQSIDRR